jgi:hypothetical protein
MSVQTVAGRPIGVPVVLSEQELLQGLMAGGGRQIESVMQGRADQHGAPVALDWQNHIEGALGELAVAKVLGLYWNYGIGVFKGPDVADLQVRTTRHGNGRLLVHREDAGHARFVLVTGANGRYVVRGWIYGWLAKRPKYWTEPQPGRGCYAVPQEDLRPIDGLSRERYG